MNTTTPAKPTAPAAPVPYSVTLPDGTVEKLVIRPLTISKLYQWLYLAKDQSEPAMVALAVDRDMAWIDSLDVDQFARLAGKCNEVLFPMAARLAKSAPAAAALLARVIQWQELGIRAIAILSTGFGEQSPTPPALGSAAAMPNGSPTPTALTDSSQSSPPVAVTSPSAS